MNYSSALLLYCTERFRGERSANAGYYLLKGKKSSQTIQDAAWYSLRNLFHSLPHLSKAEYDRMIENLLEKNFLELKGYNLFVTVCGKEWMEKTFRLFPIPPFFNGWKYGGVEMLFWKRLSLLVQTLSHWVRFQSSFLPVQRDLSVQLWVKTWIRQREGNSREELATGLFHELYFLLSRLSEKGYNPDLFVYRLSGYEATGYTRAQTAKRLNMEESYYSIVFRGFLHFIIGTIWNERDRFPLLESLVEDIRDPIVLTKSALYTRVLIRKGKSVDEIVQIRKLKRSTIEDHIVEIALRDPEFSIDGYVSIDMQKKIADVADQLSTRKLKRIKESVEDADYFSIRLVLSKLNEIRKRD